MKKLIYSSKINTFRSREEFATSMLDKYKNKVNGNLCSDIGSGFGWMGKHIQQAGKTWQPFDYVRKIDEAVIWDLNNPCPIGSYYADMCFMLEVLEHTANPLIAIQNISDHLKTDAILVISVPNPSWSRNRIHLFFKGFLYSFQKKHLQEHHVFTPWRHIVEFFFEQTGFEVLEYHAINQPEKRPINTKEFFIRLLQKLIEKRDSEAIGLSYGLVLKKKD